MTWSKSEAEIRADERRRVEREILEWARGYSDLYASRLLDGIRTGDYYSYRAGPLPGSPTDTKTGAK